MNLPAVIATSNSPEAKRTAVALSAVLAHISERHEDILRDGEVDAILVGPEAAARRVGARVAARLVGARG